MNQATPPQAQQEPNLSPPPKLYAVSLVTGELWQLGTSVPGSELTKSRGTDPSNPAMFGREIEGTEGTQILVIMDMFENEDRSIEVYASPIPGSAFDRQSTGAIFTLYPLTIARTLTVARFDVWKQMLAEATADAMDPGDDGDEDDDDEPEPPVVAPPALSAPPNGSAPITGATS